MATPEKQINQVIRVGNTLTNLIDKQTKQVFTADKVTTYYDGTPMTDAKVDGYIYRKAGNEYFLKNLGKYEELFLEKDTVDQLRSLSNTEILLLKMKFYKGVTLNGYYSEGDTPAPIQYYLSDTTESDDGGSVFEVGVIKLEHDFQDYIHVSYFGCKGDDESEDCTIKYNSIIKASIEGGSVEFYADKEYRGSFVSNKSLKIIQNNAVLSNYTNVDPILRFNAGVSEKLTTVTSSVSYGDIFINVDDASEIEPGMIISISDNKLRPADNMVVNKETLLVKSVDIVNNIVEVHDMVRSSQDTAPIYLDVVKTPIVGVEVSNGKYKSNDTHIGGNSMQLSFFGCINTTVRNIETSNNVGNPVGFRGCVNYYIENVIHHPPRLNGGGEGYGVTSNYSRDGVFRNITGYKMRHVLDFSTCYNMDIKTVRDYDSFSPIQLAHNTFGGNFKVEDVIVDGQSYAALHVQGQGLSNANAHIFRDLIIENVTHVIRAKTSGSIKTIRIESSVNNIKIENINLINKDSSYTNSFVEDNIVSIASGSINGPVDIKNIRSNKISYPFYHSLGTLVSDNNSIVKIDGVFIGSCYRIGLLLGTRRFSINNVEAIGALSDGVSMLDTSNGSYLKECYIGDNVRLNSYIPYFSIEPTSLLLGYNKKLGLGNNEPFVAYSTSVIARKTIDCRNVIKFTNNFAADVVTTSANFIVNPLFWGEEIYIMVNGPEDFGVKGGLVISNANTNIINPDGGYGLRIRSGEIIKLKGFDIGGVKTWVAERINKQASVNTKGVVNQSANVVNVSLANAVSDTASTATDVTEMVTDFNDLVGKYNSMVTLVNELKTQLNAKLGADRTSGQQSTT